MAEAFPISGQIDPKAFPYLLMELHRNRATGSLKVDGPSYQKALYYRSGRILFASSNDPRDQLGAILIEEGKLTPEQLEDVNSKVGPGSPLAKVLADNGYVSQRELGDAARTKVESILSDILAYETGSFEFEDGVLPKGAVDLKLSTERLVLAAVRRIAERSFVLRILGGLDVVLAPCAESTADASEVQAETASLLHEIDGSRDLKELTAQTSLEEFDAAKLACALLLLGIVEKVTTAEERETGVDLTGTARMAFGEPELSPSVSPADRTHSPAPEIPASEEFAIDAGFGSIGFETNGRPGEAEPPIPPREPLVAPPPDAQPAVAPPPTVRSPEPPLASALTPPGPSGLPLIPPPPRTERSATRIAAIPDIPVPARPATSRPSKADLEALDTLLGKRTYEGPLSPLEKAPARKPAAERSSVRPPTASWEPRFGQIPRRGGQERRLNPLVVAITLAFVAGAAGGGYWYLKLRPAAGKPRLVAAATPPPSHPTTPSTPPAASAASPPATTVAPTPLSGVSTAPAAATPTPMVATPVPTATPVPKPSPGTAHPPAPVSASSIGDKVAEARSLLRKGQLSQAARAFAEVVKASPANTHSVQLLVACSDDTVEKAARAVSSPELFIVPVGYKGRSCYRMCWGLYENEARATSASRSVPGYFLDGGARPKVVPASTLLH